jgi:hypothetical protein
MARKKQMTFTDHRELGASLHRMRHDLLTAGTIAGNHHSLKLMRKLDKLGRHIEAIRQALEIELFRDRPEGHGPEGPFLSDIYYPCGVSHLPPLETLRVHQATGA